MSKCENCIHYCVCNPLSKVSTALSGKCNQYKPLFDEETEAILKKAIETYGTDMQLNVAVEEFAELTKEICKHKRGNDNTEAIVEEMADCYIMLEQMTMIFGLGSTVIADAINNKVKRLKKRLGREE